MPLLVLQKIRDSILIIMVYHTNKKLFTFIGVFLLATWTGKHKYVFFQSDKYVLGGFMNVDADGLDFELLANVESQIDYIVISG